MKNLLKGVFLFIFFTHIAVGAYTPSKNDLTVLNAAKEEIIKLYNESPVKAYNVNNNIDKFYTAYKNKPKTTFILGYIDSITQEYIKEYEAKVATDKQKEEQQKEQEQKDQQEDLTKYPDFNDIITTQDNKLQVFVESGDTKTLATFNIEPKYDHIYLQNVYFQNIGTVSDMYNLFSKLYLVDDKNRIISTGYVNNNYLFFDITSNYILQQSKVKTFYVKADLREPNSQSQTGELKFKIATPSGAAIGTLNGIRATSYSNGSYITIDIDSQSNPMTTLVSYSSSYVVRDYKFNPSYSEAIGFTLHNNGKNRLEVKEFELEISGSFLNSVTSDTTLVVKIKGTNQVFGSGLLQNMANGKLAISYGGGSAPNYLSANTSTEYVVEIINKGNPKGKREVRLNNIKIGDGFGGTISDLNNYSGTGLPTEFVTYDY